MTPFDTLTARLGRHADLTPATADFLLAPPTRPSAFHVERLDPDACTDAELTDLLGWAATCCADGYWVD